MRSPSCENRFYSHENETKLNKTNFHVKGFVPGLALKQRRKASQKWAIELVIIDCLPLALPPLFTQSIMTLFVMIIIIIIATTTTTTTTITR